MILQGGSPGSKEGGALSGAGGGVGALPDARGSAEVDCETFRPRRSATGVS